jgi:hypothetical protein
MLTHIGDDRLAASSILEGNTFKGQVIGFGRPRAEKAFMAILKMDGF